MSVRDEIHQLLARQTRVDPRFFEGLVSGEETAVAAEDLLSIILKQDALEHAVLKLAERVDQLEKAPSGLEPE